MLGGRGLLDRLSSRLLRRCLTIYLPNWSGGVGPGTRRPSATAALLGCTARWIRNPRWHGRPFRYPTEVSVGHPFKDGRPIRITQRELADLLACLSLYDPQGRNIGSGTDVSERLREGISDQG